MQGHQIVTITLARCTFDLPRNDLTIDIGSHDRAYRRCADVLPVAEQSHFQPVISGDVVTVECTSSHQVQVAVMIVVGPAGLVGRNLPGQSHGGGHVDKVPITDVFINPRVVSGIDRGEVQIQIAVVIDVGQGRRGVRLLIIRSVQLVHQLECVTALGPGVPQEHCCGLTRV